MLTLGAAGGWFFRGTLKREEPARVVLVGERKELVEEREEIPDPAAPSEEKKVPEEIVKNPLGEAFERWVSTPELKGASVGFCVLDESGALVYGSPLAETALCPASALKSMTAGAALGLLGEDFRFVTVLAAEGGMANGVVTGDLLLVGGGDPTLSADDLEDMADRAVKGGLKRVRGKLTVDGGVFPQTPVSDHWVWGDLGNAYGAGAFGLNVGHNVTVLAFDGAAEEGKPAKFLGSDPELPGVKWDVAVGTGPAGSGDRVMVYSSPYGSRVEASGTVPLGATYFGVRAAVPDPPTLAGDLLKKALEKRGVVFANGPGSDSAARPLLRHESAPLVSIIGHMQEVSDNLEAQCLFLMMGVKAKADPVGTLRGYWEKEGVGFAGLRLIDGSGLARATMIRPVDLATINLKARKAAYGENFFATLPGNDTMRAKRGAMSGVRTEAGFIRRGGKEYVFALMANGLGPQVDFWKLRSGLLAEIGK